MARRSDDVVRDGLLRQLPLATDDHRLVIVAAPGGWGKTTLLGTWEAAASDTQFRWCSLTPPDNDTTRFINRLVDTASPLVDETPLPDPGASTPMVWVEKALPMFVEALDASGPNAIVLDDYHLIDNPDTHGVVQSLVDGVGPETLVVLSSRVDPPLKLARLRAARAVTEIRSEDLRFTVADTDELLRNAFSLDLSPEHVELLVNTTEGWPAALSLAAQSLRSVNDPEEFLTRFVSTDRLIVDYLAEELLDTLPAAHQLFLHDTSVVDMFVPGLAAALTSGGKQSIDAAEIGEDLERRGLVSRHYESNRLWFRYHQLLRDVLYRRLEPETQRARHLTAGAWFVANDQPRRAIEQLTSGGEIEQAASLVAEHAADYVLRGRYATVIAWITDLADAPDVDPGLFLLGAQAALYGGHLEQGQAWLTRAESGSNLSISEQLLALSLRATVAHADGRIADAITVADELVDRYEASNGDIGLDPGELADCLLVAGVAFSLGGQTERSEQWLDRCISIAGSGGPHPASVAALGMKSMHAYAQGDVAAAESIVDRAFSVADELGLSPTSINMAPSLATRVLTGSDDAAREAIEHFLEICEHLYTPYGIAHGHSCEAFYWMRAGDHDRADRALVAARDLLDEIKQPAPLIEQYYEIVSGQLAGEPGGGPVAGPTALTDRELQVLRAFSSNLSQREIGRELFLSFNTIKTYARSAYRKLGVSSRAEAVAVCREAGVF